MSTDVETHKMISKMIRRYKFIMIAFSIPLIEGIITNFFVTDDVPKSNWVVVVMSLFIILIMATKIVLLKKALK